MGDGLIKVGVVGLGVFGRHHARHYAVSPAARLVGVADVDYERAGRAADDFDTVAYSDYRALIRAVDAVSIAVPAIDHAAVAHDFVSAGVHVLLEKPIATDTIAARTLLRAAEEADVVLQVGHIERFSPVVREMRGRVHDPRRISTVRRAPWSGRSTDVDVVLDMMIHDIDHVLAFACAPIASVAASGVAVRSGAIDEAEAWLTFANGVVATLSASRVAAATERRLAITEPSTMFEADLVGNRLAIADRGGASIDTLRFEAHDNLAAEIAAFLASVAGGDPPEVDGRVGLAALTVAERIQAAIEEPATPRARAKA